MDVSNFAALEYIVGGAQSGKKTTLVFLRGKRDGVRLSELRGRRWGKEKHVWVVQGRGKWGRRRYWFIAFWEKGGVK